MIVAACGWLLWLLLPVTQAAANLAPVTTPHGIPEGWSQSDVTFTLTNDYGVPDMYYIVGNDGPHYYGGPVTVTAEGSTMVGYWTVEDPADNIEPVKWTSVRIDRSPPFTVISGLPSGLVPPGQFTFTLSPGDQHSGVERTLYRVDDGPEQVYAGPVTISASRAATIRYWSRDYAGNVEPARSASIRVDDGLPQTAISGVPAAWSLGDVTFALAASPSPSSREPVAGTFFALGSAPAAPYSGPVTVSGEGDTVVSYYSMDAAGGREVTRTARIRVDKTKPVSEVSGIPGTVSRSAVTFTLAGSDMVSGLAAIRYRLGAGTVRTYAGPVTVRADGETPLTWWAVDVAGNEEAPHIATIRIDLGVPVTTVSGVPDGWSRSDVVATLSATTGSAYSTISAIRWAYGSGEVHTYTGPVTLTTEGVRTLYYFSESSSGLSEAVRSAQVRIDKTSPASSADGIPAGTAASDVTFSLSATDAHSGVAAIHYRLGAGAVLDYAGPVTVSADGVTPVSWWAEDAAGNAETPHTATVTISRGPVVVPDTSIGGVPAGWSSHDVTFTLSAYSPAHPVTGTYYRIGGGALATYGAPVPVAAEGVTAVSFYSVDDIGGREATKTATIRIDKTPPVSSASGLPSADATSAVPVVFSLSASDALSGLALIRYRLDDGPAADYAAPVTVSSTGTTVLTWWAVDNAGNAERPHSALIRIGVATPPPPPSGDVTTTITITSSAGVVRVGQTAILSGRVTPVGVAGTVIVVYVRKPGSPRWTYSSNRVTYLLAGSAAWQYKYYFRPGMAKGVYRFKAAVPRSAGLLASQSGTIAITAR